MDNSYFNVGNLIDLTLYDFICILFVPWLKYLNLCYLANIMTFQNSLNWITLFKVYLSKSLFRVYRFKLFIEEDSSKVQREIVE